MNWIKSVSVVMISIFVSLGMAELGLRLIFPDRESTGKARDHSNPHIPKMTEGEHHHDELDVVASFDSDGFRKNPYNCSDGEVKKRLLLVGDSNIAAVFLTDKDTLGSQIAKLSVEAGECVHVDSFGVSGFGPDQNFKAIDSITARNAYDAVVFHVFADNDLGDLLRNNVFQDNQIKDIGYCYPEAGLWDDLLLARAVRRAVYVATGYFINWNYPASSLRNDENCEMVAAPYSDNYAEALFERAKIDKELFLNGRRQIYMGDRYDIEFACHADDQLDLYVSDVLTNISMGMTRLSADRGFEVIYLIQPSEVDTTSNHVNRTSSIIERCGEKYSPTNLTRYFLDAFKGAEIIDLYATFEGCNECYFTEDELGEDNHWSPHGVEKAAELVFETVVK